MGRQGNKQLSHSVLNARATADMLREVAAEEEESVARQCQDSIVVQEVDESDGIGFDDVAHQVVAAQAQRHDRTSESETKSSRGVTFGECDNQVDECSEGASEVQEGELWEDNRELEEQRGRPISKEHKIPPTIPAVPKNLPEYSGSAEPDLHAALEKQFAVMQQVLATQHKQALRVVGEFCDQARKQQPHHPCHDNVNHGLASSLVGNAMQTHQDPSRQVSPPSALVKPPSCSFGTRRVSQAPVKRDQVASDDPHNRLMLAKEEAKKLIKSDADNQNGPKSVFPDTADMKAKVKEAIMRPEYNVANFYKTTGSWQAIARASWFDNLTLAVIALNALWISIDTDHNDAATLPEADLFFQVGENSFCIYFSLELLCRFLSFQSKADCRKDGWFVFDSLLVFMMVIETWLLNFVFFAMGGSSGNNLGNASILRLVRLLRLTRMARMVRLLRALPELMILVKGISVATRSVFFTLCLLGIFIYIFAIAFTQLAKDTDLEQEYFPNVPEAMNTLLLRGVLPDQAEFVTRIGQEHVMLAVTSLFFILLTSLTVMNMLVGVLCEVVSVVSSVEKEQMTVQFVKTKLLALIKNTGVDHDGDRYLSKAEFHSLLLVPEGARIIEEVGVDVVGLVDFADDIFKDEVQLSFHDFMDLVLQLRCSNNATVRDVVDLRKLVSHQLQEIQPIVERSVATLCAEVTSKMQEASDSMMLFAQAAQVQAAVAQPVAQLDNGSWSPNPQPHIANDGSTNSIGRRVTGSQRPYSTIQTRPSTTDANPRRRPTSGMPRCTTQGAEQPQVKPVSRTTWMTEFEDEGTTFGESLIRH